MAIKNCEQSKTTPRHYIKDTLKSEEAFEIKVVDKKIIKKIIKKKRNRQTNSAIVVIIITTIKIII